MKKRKKTKTFFSGDLIEDLFNIIQLIIVIFLIVSFFVHKITSKPKTEWSCIDVTSIDYNWDNDYKCKNKETGEVVYVSEQKAKNLMYFD